MAFENNPINTGNFFNDVAANIKVVLDFYRETLGVREVFADDPAFIKYTPIIGITAVESAEEIINLSRIRKQIDLLCDFEVFTYFENLEQSYRKNELAKLTWQIADVLRMHHTLNGYLLQKCASVAKIQFEARPRENGLLSGSLIIVRVPFRHTVEGLL